MFSEAGPAPVEAGIREGATLVAGGLGRPDGLEQSLDVKLTIVADVTKHMTVAREEIFGPVLTILGYEDVAEAINIASDTAYGLAAYVQGAQNEAEAVHLAFAPGRFISTIRSLTHGEPPGHAGRCPAHARVGSCRAAGGAGDDR